MLLWPLVRVFLKIKFNYSCMSAPKIKGPLLILANHTTDYDMLMAAMSFKRHMYFVGRESLYRSGFWGGILKFFFDPIAFPKGGRTVSAVKEILRRLKSGSSVCLYPEGNTSFSGETNTIMGALGKLVKHCGATVVTFKTEGGYFSAPRWAFSDRRGRIYGHPVKVYTPEDISAMSADGLNEAIRRDLYENAYQRQEKEHIAYRGRRLAEGLEYALLLCPKCGGLDTLKSGGNEFFCSCGLRGTLDEYGYLSGEGFDFSTVLQWDVWQKERLMEAESGVCRDEGQTLYRIESHRRVEAARGRLEITGEALSCGDRAFPLEEIADISVFGKGAINFSLRDGSYFEIKGKSQCHGRKYYFLFHKFKGTAVRS